MDGESPLPGVIPDAPENATMAPLPAGFGGTVASSLVNALAGAAGYATQDRLLEQNSLQREQRNQQMAMLGPVGKALGDANIKLATGDLQGAMAAYQPVSHLGILVPAVQQFGTKLAEQAYALKQKAAMAAVLSQPDHMPGALGTEAERSAPSVLDNRQTKLNQLVTLNMDPEKATKLVYPDLKTEKMEDGSVAVFNPRTGQLAIAYQGMGRPVTPGTPLVARGPGGAITPTYTAPRLLDVPSALEPFMSASDRVAYNEGINSKSPDGLDRADAIAANATAAYAASKSPADVKGAAQRLGYGQADIAAFENGTLDSAKAQRITSRLLQDDMIKKASELNQLKAINMELDPATKAFPKYAAYVDVTGNLVDAGSINGADAVKGMKSGALAPLDAEAQRRFQMMNNLAPQYQTAKDQIPRLFAGVTPGASLGNAIKLYAQKIGGGGAARLQQQLAIDMSAEQTKIITGSSRPPVAMFEHYMKDGPTPTRTDSAESALARVEFAENVTNSAKTNLTNRPPMSTVDPYKTNPILRQLDQLRQAGKHPVLSVDPQGRYTITDYK